MKQTTVKVEISAEKIGNHIHTLMKQKGYTVLQIQDAMNMESTQAIYKWFKGKCLPSINSLFMLSIILDTTVEALIKCELVNDVEKHIHDETVVSINARETGIHIAQLMDQKGINVTAVKDAMGFKNPQAIYKWLNGKSFPTLSNSMVLSSLLDVTVDELLVKAA